MQLISVFPGDPGFSPDHYDFRWVNLESAAYIMTRYSWSNCLWSGGYRRERYFCGSYFCALDIDDGMSKEEFQDKIGDRPHILGPTKSDGIMKNGVVCDRFRVLIPWAVPISRLDVYRFNMREIIKEFQGDSQTSDGGRVWQPCSRIETIISSGSPMPVTHDIPEEQTDAYKQQRMSEIFEFRKKSKTLSAKTQDFLQGHHIKGEMNSRLFSTACELFNHGHSLEDLRQVFEPLGVTKWHNYESTVNSAARHAGHL